MKKYALYFSPNGRTEAVVRALAEALSEEKYDALDVTKPESREKVYEFTEGDVLIIGFPTYAGKLPNKILPFIKGIKGNGAIAVGVVTYGNRSYDNSLAELMACLRDSGFRTVSGIAVPCQHAFSDKLAHGRPDEEDLDKLRECARIIGNRIGQLAVPGGPDVPENIAVPGDPDAPYYTPLTAYMTPAKFLKAVPKTIIEKCDLCGVCAKVCPMGIIDSRNFVTITGPCIKCQACVNKCHKNAKYFDDEDFLSHVEMLKANYSDEKTGRKEIEIFLKI